MREAIERRFAVSGCYLAESDPDIVVVRRQDDSFVAAFSAMGATEESIVEAAEEDGPTPAQEPPHLPGREGKEQPVG